MLTTILLGFGCSRPTPDLTTEEARQSSPTPFQTQTASAVENDPQASSFPDRITDPPFQNPEMVPAGSLVIVRLKAPLAIANGSMESFEAVLDEPVVVDGNALIPRDAVVSGEIESAHIAEIKPDRGYVRLTLTSVQLDGSSVPIQTASLFVRRPWANPASPQVFRLDQGRRLTFRLKDQVFLHPSLSKRSPINP